MLAMTLDTQLTTSTEIIGGDTLGVVDRFKHFFRKVGDTLNADELQRVIDHPKIAMTQEEYNRIQENKMYYANEFPNVEYMSSTGKVCERPYSSINATKIMASELASLVFNEGVQVTLDDDKAQEFLDDIFNKSKFHKNFREELEAGYAISGLAIRPYVDVKTNEVKLSYCSADTFFPLNSNTNDISEAVIITTTQQTEGKDTIYYTLMEFHEWLDNGKYLINNELYRSTDSKIVGRRVPLTSVEQFANIQPQTFIEGLTRPLFTYIKLSGKNNINLSSPLGMGIADNAKAQLKNLNDVYDQYMNEVKKSTSKMLVSDHVLNYRFDKHGKPIKYLDDKTDVYQLYKGDSDDFTMQEFVPTLRTGEFTQTVNFILQIAEVNVGFSSGTFSFDANQGIKTATEVVSENSKTFRTRNDNVLLLEEALKELITTIFELASGYGLYNGNTDFHINVDFDDGVFVDEGKKLDYYLKATQGALLSKRSAMMRALGMSDKEAEEEMAYIAKESANGLIGDNPEVRRMIDDRVMFGIEE